MTDSEWEKLFEQWSKPPSTTEQDRCNNAIVAVRNAVRNSSHLRYTTQVFVQGSYRNRVNVRQDSDVDVGVIYKESYFYELTKGTTQLPIATSAATYSYEAFKNELETALRSHFKAGVTRGNKSIKVRENSYHVDADVVPFFHLRTFNAYGETRRGVSLVPDDGGHRIDNYPERLADDWPKIPLHYENGVSKNYSTYKLYKGAIRILKTLRNELAEANIDAARFVSGYLIECLVFNVPNTHFTGSWITIIRSLLTFLWSRTKKNENCAHWTEVDEIKYLFHTTQPWTIQQAHAFVDAAWSHIGVK